MVFRYKINNAISIYKEINSNKYFVFNVETGQPVAKVNKMGKFILENIENTNFNKIVSKLDKDRTNIVKSFIAKLLKNKIIKFHRR